MKETFNADLAQLVLKWFARGTPRQTTAAYLLDQVAHLMRGDWTGSDEALERLQDRLNELSDAIEENVG